MTSRDDASEQGKASRLMRNAILEELRRPAGEGPPPIDKLHQIARALVDKAGQGDMTAIKEILDRIDGKSSPGMPEMEAVPSKVSFAWKQASA